MFHVSGFMFYDKMLSKISDFVKRNLDTIILIVVMAFLVLLSFAAGYIMANERNKQPIIIEDLKR